MKLQCYLQGIPPPPSNIQYMNIDSFHPTINLILIHPSRIFFPFFPFIPNCYYCHLILLTNSLPSSISLSYFFPTSPLFLYLFMYLLVLHLLFPFSLSSLFFPHFSLLLFSLFETSFIKFKFFLPPFLPCS
jgi:hypothetical protein